MCQNKKLENFNEQCNDGHVWKIMKIANFSVKVALPATLRG
jgi:hypothetical protein